VKWYVINTVSGQENRVKDAILETAEKRGVSSDLGEIFIPAAKIARMSRGKKVFSERKFFPGYVFIKMVLSDEMWSGSSRSEDSYALFGTSCGRCAQALLSYMC